MLKHLVDQSSFGGLQVQQMAAGELEQMHYQLKPLKLTWLVRYECESWLVCNSMLHFIHGTHTCQDPLGGLCNNCITMMGSCHFWAW